MERKQEPKISQQEELLAKIAELGMERQPGPDGKWEFKSRWSKLLIMMGFVAIGILLMQPTPVRGAQQQRTLEYIDLDITVRLNYAELSGTAEPISEWVEPEFDKHGHRVPTAPTADYHQPTTEPTDAYYQEPERQGLTPYGQGSVVDNVYNTDNIEFFTFDTPAGNTFFLIVDRYNTEHNVHLLNAVTELDLFLLTYEQATPDLSHLLIEPEVPEPERVYIYVYRDSPQPAPEPEASGGDFPWFLLLVPVGIGGAWYYKKRKKQSDEDDEFADSAGGDEFDHQEFDFGPTPANHDSEDVPKADEI